MSGRYKRVESLTGREAKDALAEVIACLDCAEWSPDTLDEIAAAIERACGWTPPKESAP